MGAIGALIIVLGLVVAISVPATMMIVWHIRDKRANRPKPVDPAEVVKQIERGQHREWEAEYNRLINEHNRKLPPGSRPLPLRAGYDPWDDDGEEYEIHSFNGAVLVHDFVPNALATSMSKADIMAWQWRAVKAGLYKGPVDGWMNAETWAAIRELDRRAKGIHREPPNPSVILEL